MAVAIRPQVVSVPTDGTRPAAIAFALEPEQERHASTDRTPWQDLRLFGRGRHPRSFKAGAEQIGDRYL
jgi:hypothetical protein